MALNEILEVQDLATRVSTCSIGPLQAGNGTLHHLGFAVASIAAAAESFCLSMSVRWDGQIIHDPLQQVRVAFFRSANDRNPILELVEPEGPVSPVSNFLKKRVGFHHVCYEVDDLDLALTSARGVGLAIVSGPTPAVAFDSRRIAWVCSKNRLFLMELLERAEPQVRTRS